YLDTDYTSIDEMKRCFRPGIDFSFISNSTLTKGEMNYKWTFGTTNFTFRDPGDTKVNARMIFNEPGTFPVKLVVTSDKGCMDSIIRNVYLSKPISSFATTITPDPLGDIRRPTISFTNNSSDPGAINTLTHLWTYENGTTLTNTTIVPFAPTTFTPTPNQFARGGNYTTSLRVTSDIGCVHTSSSPLSFFVRPEASFTVNTPVLNSNGRPVVTVTNLTSTVDETPTNLSYSWNFGDGSVVNTSSPTMPSHTYTVGAATRTITLTVTNNNGGLTAVTTQTLNNVYIKPKSAFTFSRVGNNFSTVQVAFNSNTSSTNESGTTLTYDWDFGDGSAHSSSANPTHVYPSGGSYTVTLVVTNSNGSLTATSSQTVTYYVTPTAQFTSNVNYNGDFYSNPLVEFSASNTTVNDASANLVYSWNFGDGSSLVSGIAPSHSYATGGNKTVTLTVTNTNGNTTNTIAFTVNVVITPKASIAIRDLGMMIEVAGNEASAPSTIATGTIDTYSWNYSWVNTTTNVVDGPYNVTGPTLNIVTVPGSKIVLSLSVTSNLNISDTKNAEFGGSTPGGYATFRTTRPRSNDLPILDIQRANVDVINTAPNPTNNSIRLSFKTNATKVNVQIVDLMGRVLQKQTQVTRSGMVNAAIIDVSSLPRGNYNVNIYDEKGNRFATSKFIKVQ
ncbi:MAG: PKD domain-containing protein, partial [Chitinophagaceae bacterium]